MKYLINFFLFIQLLQFSLAIQIDLVNTLPVKITCDNSFTLYHNGAKIGSGNSWQTTYSYNVKLSPAENVFALEGVNTGSIGGFIGTFGNENTLTTVWRCKDFNKIAPIGWNSIVFNDTAWPVAVSYGKNNNLNVWKQRPSISENAEWLWTNDNKKHDTIYCRYKLLNKLNIQLNKINKTVVKIVEEKESNIDTLINYHNESNVKLKELEEKISKILHETHKKYEEDIKINENNIKITNNTLNSILNKKTVIITRIRILHEKIIKLNISIHEHYKQMHEDTEYLKRLTILKPKFLKTLDNVNEQLGLVKNYISDTLVEGEDKNGLLRIIFDLHNSTKYTTMDISHAFLVHLEKYKNRMSGNNKHYEEEISKLEKYQTTYTLYMKEKKDIVSEYKRVVEIIKKLRETYNLSIDELDLFNELVMRISGLLKNNNCNVESYLSPELEKECSTALLKSHMDNNHL
jgi:hypothetical protein